jgi:hypothetical protein
VSNSIIPPAMRVRWYGGLVILLVMASAARAFTPRTLHRGYPSDAVGFVMKWDLAAYPDGAIPYWINRNIPAGFTPFEPTSSIDAVLARVHEAFRTWEHVSTARVRFRFAGFTDATDVVDGNMVVSFTAAPARGGPIDTGCRASSRNTQVTGAAGVILPQEFVGQIVECDPTIHALLPQAGTAWWVSDASPPSRNATGQQGPLDLQGLLTHEIGHVLGLDHSGTAETATMTIWTQSGVSVGGFTLRTLSTDDAIGVSTLYPTDEFLRGTGTIAGEVLREQTGSPVFGAHVVAIDAATGVIVAGAATGVLQAGPDGMAARFQSGSGVYRLSGLPPGIYRIYVEPFDGPSTNWLGGVFGTSADQQFMETDFSPVFHEGDIEVRAGATTADVDLRVASRATDAPNLDLVAWISESGVRTDPVLVRPGTSLVMELAPGENIVAAEALIPGASFSFAGSGITITRAQARRTITLNLSIAPDAPLGPRLLQVTTPAGVAFLSGALTVIPQ